MHVRTRVTAPRWMGGKGRVGNDGAADGHHSVRVKLDRDVEDEKSQSRRERHALCYGTSIIINTSAI